MNKIIFDYAEFLVIIKCLTARKELAVYQNRFVAEHLGQRFSGDDCLEKIVSCQLRVHHQAVLL